MNPWILSAVFFVAVLPFQSDNFSAEATPTPAETGLKKTVSLLIEARNNIVAQYEIRQQQVASPAETEELSIFLEYLDGRIIHYCRELHRLYGETSIADSPCPGYIAETDSITKFNPGELMAQPTEKEAEAELQGSFEESLHQFDEMLLKEQEKIAGTVPRLREAASGAMAGNGSGRDTDESLAGNTSSQRENNRQNPDSKAPSGMIPAGGNSVTKHKPPTEGSRDLSQTDDDIIAKQLREAAEQEADPEVKEKLWEEYRKYKEKSR